VVVTLPLDFSTNICVDGTHPLRIFVQPQGDCKGLFVTNTTPTSFQVTEMQSGTSNVQFGWFASANRKDQLCNDGVTLAHYQDTRCPALPTAFAASTTVSPMTRSS